MPSERDKPSENPYGPPSEEARLAGHERVASGRRRWPWWLNQPEVSFGGGGIILFLLLAGAMLIYSFLVSP
jgi:hypothetical protein